MKLKHILAGFGLLTFVGLFTTPVLAAEMVSPTKDNPNVIIGSQEVHKNLYTVGGNVTVNGDVSGDLTAAGGTVTVAGKIEQQALIAGGTLFLAGPIGGHARIAGGNVTISGPVGGDLVIAGGNVNITSKSEVVGDLIIAGGNIVVDAPVKGNIKIAGGNITLNSKVGGSVLVKSNQQLTFGPLAEISGEIKHQGTAEAVVNSGAKISSIQFTQVQKKDFSKQVNGLLTMAFLIKILAWFIAGLVLVKLLKNNTQTLVAGFRGKPWENLLYGALTLISTPIIVLILFVSFVGYYLGFLLLSAFVFTLILAGLLGSILLGYYLLSFMGKVGDAPVAWQAVLIGVVAWIVLSFIPVVGWLAMCVLFLMSLGILVKAIKELIK